MQVRLFGTLRHFAGTKAIDIPVEPGDTVRTVLQKVTKELPALGEKVFDAEGNLQSSLNVLVNGRNTRFLDGLDHPVEDEDAFALFPSVGGG